MEEDKNIISDPDLHEFYDKILIITRGELFSGERIRTILDMNLGRYDHLVESYVEHHPEILVSEE